MGFVRIFWKNNVQEAYLPKMSISGQIVSEIVAQLCLENSIQRQFAPKCSFLVSRPLGHCYFRISWQIPWFQKLNFYDVTTLVLYFMQSEGGTHPQPDFDRFDSWLAERKTSLFSSLAAVSQNKLSVFCCPFYRSFRRTQLDDLWKTF